jgi:hypothetical protein
VLDTVSSAEAFQIEHISSLAVTNFSGVTNFVIDAHGDTHNRDTLDLRIETYHSRAREDPLICSYRLDIRIIDSFGQPHQIYSEDGLPGSVFHAYFSVNLTRLSEITHIEQISCRPYDRFNPQRSYMAVVELWEWTETPEGHYVLRSNSNTASYVLYHFNSTNSADEARNVIAVLDDGGFHRASVINTDPNRRRLAVDVAYSLYRYDAFDAPLSADWIDVGFDVSLFEVSDPRTPIPIASVSQDHTSVRMDTYTSVSPPVPAQRRGLTDTLRIELAEGAQLDSVNGRYIVAVTMNHREVQGQAMSLDNQLSFGPQQILHFNGRLMFGAIETTLLSVTNDPVPVGRPDESIPTVLNLGNPGGYVVGLSGYTFGNVSLSVELNVDGTAFVTSGWVPVNLPNPDFDLFHNVRFRRESVLLTQTGAYGDLLVYRSVNRWT